MDNVLFKNVEDALKFAFCYCGQQSPRTPMSSTLQGGTLGSGKGLYGTDGAAQAGMILAKVDALPREQRWVLTVRFVAAAESTVDAIGQPVFAPPQAWLEAADGLASATEFDGMHKLVRRAVIAKLMCGHRVNLSQLCERHGVSYRTLQRKQDELRRYLAKLERTGLDKLSESMAGLLQAA